MPMSWSPEADARLLIAIINTTSNINWDAAASFLGEDCTVSAIKHRVARLKEKAGVPSTPRTKGGKTKRTTSMKASKDDLAKAKAKGDKKAKANVSLDDDNSDDIEDSNDGEVKERLEADSSAEY
ncbi:AT hook motif protein [Penicillium subrubescens]|uniref:Myb-like domain-containing protein n=1 Tax=Penicillium subrubescens TaxID=1316194 RepID=A0A1Q5TBV1_9EURO|nr:AT hook motif protein [Penicillium subrubescens]KAJ5892220.1 AT hook motif protein [Penicillium subrubescens]OKO97701.1 hypothetical protein PENSUB_9992 [Penicillium subrubescens]